MPLLFRITVVIGSRSRTDVSMSVPDIPKAPSPITLMQKRSGRASLAPIISGMPMPRCVVLPQPM